MQQNFHCACTCVHHRIKHWENTLNPFLKNTQYGMKPPNSLPSQLYREMKNLLLGGVTWYSGWMEREIRKLKYLYAHGTWPTWETPLYISSIKKLPVFPNENYLGTSLSTIEHVMVNHLQVRGQNSILYGGLLAGSKDSHLSAWESDLHMTGRRHVYQYKIDTPSVYMTCPVTPSSPVFLTVASNVVEASTLLLCMWRCQRLKVLVKTFLIYSPNSQDPSWS